MELLAHLLIPHQRNNHHPHLIRYPNLGLIAAFLILTSATLNIFTGATPKVLGFATNVRAIELISLTNKEREENNLTDLKENAVLSAAAAKKAQDMFKKNYWAHISPGGITPWAFFQDANYVYSFAGENLARDFYTSAAVVKAWMESSTHRENILNPNYEEIGMAVVDGKLDGEETTLVVQFFGAPFKTTLIPVENLTAGSHPASAAAKLESNNQKPVSVLPSATSTTQNTVIFNSFTLENLGLTQKIYLAVLMLLFITFVIDSIILYRRRIKRQNSHSLLHASLIFILMFLIILKATKGVVI